MPSITVTVTNTEAARLQEAALNSGYANTKAWLIYLVQTGLEHYERRRDITAAQDTIDHYDSRYQPIQPT